MDWSHDAFPDVHWPNGSANRTTSALLDFPASHQQHGQLDCNIIPSPVQSWCATKGNSMGIPFPASGMMRDTNGLASAFALWHSTSMKLLHCPASYQLHGHLNYSIAHLWRRKEHHFPAHHYPSASPQPSGRPW